MKLLLIIVGYPLSLLYAAAVRLRNKCYDWRLFASVAFRLPVIVVGNLTAGGTGKTPHTEWLASVLRRTTTAAVLSRGYKRTSKGFRYVGVSDAVRQAGDEPLQIKRKYPDMTVAVDADRVRGIGRLMQDDPHLGVVILDDAYQHRRVRPALSVLLMDYNRPVYRDHYLPYGRLRDNVSRLRHADVVIVTKCPGSLPPAEQATVAARLKLLPRQLLYFTTFRYAAPQPVFDGYDLAADARQAVAVTGIANDAAFVQYLQQAYDVVRHLPFADHHFFTPNDAAHICAAASAHPEALLFTTEKDAQRLRSTAGLSESVKRRLFYIPVSVAFLPPADEAKFTDYLVRFLQAYMPPTVSSPFTMSKVKPNPK
ncbi:MAG: tetraacyldisaccharide 4'-kinase [Prevotellaceae bacterium]|jgi:tetraacyldisaccharide 4'-kinase|nr:tetraacyldisaccharide 4'-kinase [Prevotellaceae bacterium]